MSRIFWFRKDLRLQDNEALTRCAEAAITDGDSQVIACFTFETNSFENLSGIRQHSLAASLESLSSSMSGSLHVLPGNSFETIAKLAKQNDVEFVHATESFDPAGIREQKKGCQILSRNW
jgi:deoxyribodipyrimidine photo-lyase